MNQKIVLTLIFIGVILIVGCAENRTVYKEIDIGCLPDLRYSSDALVIKNQDEYDALLAEYKGLPSKNCDAKLTPINFKKYTLLSRFDGGSGCSTEFKKNVQIDHENKKVIFTIDVIESGSCEPFRTQRTSILMPKIFDDYTVDFSNAPTESP